MNSLQLFGKRIKELRKMRRCTQEQLAELAGLDVKQISNIETGASFTTMQTIEKLAECFGIEIFQLFNFSHLKEKGELTPEIINKINNASEKDVQLIAKIVNSIIS